MAFVDYGAPVDIALIIPARYQSSRLPGKPLLDLAGVPMIVRTYQQCIKAIAPKDVAVAIDDERIAATLRSYGIPYLMTSKDCLTGTDRLLEASRMFPADYYINVQGDEPLFNPADITTLIRAISRFPGMVLNGYCAITSEQDFRSSSVPKVVMRPDGRLLYMSRAAIPTTKGMEFRRSYRQVCAYAFPKIALEVFGTQPTKTPLEAVEDIEILRLLELGWEVQMIEMIGGNLPIDNPSDIHQVLAALQQIEEADVKRAAE